MVRLYAERLGDDRRRTRALLVLAGGPGQAATPLVPQLAPALAKVLDDRDIVFFDQRGTGRSGALKCRSAVRLAPESRRLAACARHLGSARDHYATSDSVADIEDLRRALGIERMTLYGVSYGTKVALEYAALHPGHVEGLVLDSVVPPGPLNPAERPTLAALPRVLGELCPGSPCRGARSPLRQLVRLERRIAEPRLRVRRVTRSGRAMFSTPRPGDALAMYLNADFDPQLRGRVAGVIAAADAGDDAPLGRLLARLGILSRYSDASDPLFVSTVCADTRLPWPARAGLGARRAAALGSIRELPARVLHGLPPSSVLPLTALDTCRAWPLPTRAPEDVPIPDVPALVLGGTADLRTPIEDARAVARRLSHSRLLVVRGAGHGVLGDTLSDCPGRALLAFLRGRPISTRCAALERPRILTPPQRRWRASRDCDPSHGSPAGSRPRRSSRRVTCATMRCFRSAAAPVACEPGGTGTASCHRNCTASKSFAGSGSVERSRRSAIGSAFRRRASAGGSSFSGAYAA